MPESKNNLHTLILEFPCAEAGTRESEFWKHCSIYNATLKVAYLSPLLMWLSDEDARKSFSGYDLIIEYGGHVYLDSDLILLLLKKMNPNQDGDLIAEAIQRIEDVRERLEYRFVGGSYAS